MWSCLHTHEGNVVGCPALLRFALGFHAASDKHGRLNSCDRRANPMTERRKFAFNDGGWGQKHVFVKFFRVHCEGHVSFPLDSQRVTQD